MPKAVLGLGGNLGDPVRTLELAIEAVGRLPGTQVINRSSFYRTAPVGYDDQPDFVNAVIVVETKMSTTALLGAGLGIEAAMLRKRTIKNGPRTIDIDLLIYEGIRMESEELTLPHPRMRERAFVIVPLQEIFPDNEVFGFDFSTSFLRLNKVSTGEVEKIE